MNLNDLKNFFCLYENLVVPNVGIGTTAIITGNRLEVTGGAIAAGNGGELRMMENLSQGTNFVAFKARGTLASDLTWLLPDSLGTSGQVMTVGSGGTLYWAAPSASVTYPLLSTTLGSVGTPVFSFSADSDTGMFSPGTGNLAFATNGTNRINIDPSGNVGVGTSAPAAKLHVFTSGGTVPTMTVDNDLIVQNNSAAGSEAGITIIGGATGFSTLALGDSGFQYRGWISSENATSALRFGSAGGEGMRLDSAGNLAVGTIAASAKLDVLGGAIKASQQSATLGGEVQFAELLSQGTNTVALRARGTLASSLTWLLPDSLGTFGQLMTVGSGGTLHWSSASLDNLSDAYTSVGTNNIFIGSGAGATFIDAAATANVVVGVNAMTQHSGGNRNTVIGEGALFGDFLGVNSDNTLVGYRAGSNASTGNNGNTGIGSESIRSLTTGSANVALGYRSGDLITTGSLNIVIGYNVDPPANNSRRTLNIGDAIYGENIYQKSGTFTLGSIAIGTNAISAGAKLQVMGAIRSSQSFEGTAGEIQMSELLAMGTNTVSLRAPGTLASSLSWILPETAGTAGQVMSVGTGGTLYWANSGGSVSYPLLSTTLGSIGTPAYSFSSDTDTGMFSPGTGTLAFTTNGTNRINITSDGNVGIGTTNPGSLFHVDNNLGASSVGTTNVAAQLSVRTTAATVSDGFGPALLFSSSINGTSYSYGRIESIRNTTDNNTDLVFKTANSGTLAEKVRISSGGAFGIGITPFSRFHVRSGTSGSSVMRADAADSSTLFEFTEAAAGYGVFAISNSAGTPTISFSAVGNSFLNGGSLGIGTIAVQAGNQLEVTGGAIAAGNGGEVRMMENLSQGTNFVAFKARGTLSTDLTWLLPDSLGTAGQVMTVGTGGTLYWANSGGSVSYPLLSTTRGSVATPAYSFNSDTDTGLFSPGTGTLALSTNGTSRIYIDALGNIGFNSSDPDSNISFSPQTRVISVTGDGSANASSTGRILLVNNRATATSGDSLGGISFHSQNNSTGTEASIGAALEGAGGGGGFGSNIQFFTKTDNVAGQTERMRLTGQGALGIGTTAPPALLAVSSSTTLAAGTTALNSYLYTNPSTAFTGLSKAGDFQSSFDGTATSSAGQLRGLEGGAYNFSSVRLGNAEGVVGYIQNSNTGSIDNATALEGNTENTSTGTIGNAFGLSLTVSKGPGVITTAYGIYTGNIQSSTGNSYSFYASDATARSYFAGTVGVGTTSPDSSLQVNGTFRANSISSSSGTAAIGSINFSNGNAITSSTDCTGAADQVKLANIRDGGSYTLVVTGTGTALCDFDEAVTGQDAATVTYRFSPTNAVRTGSSHTVYTMIRVGNIIYISWITGF